MVVGEKNAQAGWRGSEGFETEACEARRGGTRASAVTFVDDAIDDDKLSFDCCPRRSEAPCFSLASRPQHSSMQSLLVYPSLLLYQSETGACRSCVSP